jgi:hypothetical protein
MRDFQQQTGRLFTISVFCTIFISMTGTHAIAGVVRCLAPAGSFQPNSGIVRHANGNMTAFVGRDRMTRKVLVGGRTNRAAIKALCRFMLANGFKGYRISDDPNRFPRRGRKRTGSKKFY